MIQAEPFSQNDRISEAALSAAPTYLLSPEAQQEVDVALFDLAEENRFRLIEPAAPGPYGLRVGLTRFEIRLDITPAAGPPVLLSLPAAPLLPAVEAHRAVTAAYLDGVRRLPAAEIAVIDGQRKAIHDDAAAELQLALAGQVLTDHPTARRLFTLICALTWQS
ncbi:MAG: UPF0262 family protein [Pikeienuella sp.]